MEDTFLIPFFEFIEIYLNEIFDESSYIKDDNENYLQYQEIQSPLQSYIQQIQKYIFKYFYYN